MKEKRLIEFGWDEPDTEFLHHHIAEMERTPFDGCVFHVNYHKPAGGSGKFTWEAWNTNAFSDSDLKQAVDDLRATRFRRFSHNFLRFNTTPARLDWFDDYSAVLNNARLAARVARLGRCRGLLFDIEQYDGQLFDYRKQRDAAEKSWEMYAAQVRRRGREVMESFQDGFPNLTIFLTFGYSLPWEESNHGRIALARCHYGLLAPFLDGMLETTRNRASFVDGCELAYGFKDINRFAASYRSMKMDLLPIVADDEMYGRFFSFGFGLWMDHDWPRKGWNTNDFSNNSFSPEAFRSSVRAALATADEYVWIYSETPRWWSDKGTSIKLPEPYDEALRQARKGRTKD